MQQDWEVELEKLVDAKGLRSVVYALSKICFEKAEHIQTNYQDKSLAKVWVNASNAIAKALPGIHTI